MTKKDFENLEHNPLLLPYGELMQQTSTYFTRREVFSKPLSEMASGTEVEENPDILLDDDYALSDILKFVILFIDEDSPFYNYDDFDEKFEGCIAWAKIQKDSRAMYHIVNYTDWYAMIEAYYLTYNVDKEKYADWVALNRSLMNMRRFISTPTDRSDNPESAVKAVLQITQNLSKETEKLNSLKAEIFPKNKKVQKRLARQIEYLESNKERMIGYAEIMGHRKN